MKHSLGFPTAALSNYPPLPIIYEDHTPTWEYQQLVRNLAKETAPSAEELNSLGADGWEVVGLFSDPPFVYFYLKRPAKA